MRVEFPEMWSRYLRAEFRNPQAVCLAFGVSFQTACNWWNAVGRPTGDKVALDVLAHPGRFAGFLERVGRAA